MCVCVCAVYVRPRDSVSVPVSREACRGVRRGTRCPYSLKLSPFPPKYVVMTLMRLRGEGSYAAFSSAEARSERPG